MKTFIFLNPIVLGGGGAGQSIDNDDDDRTMIFGDYSQECLLINDNF